MSYGYLIPANGFSVEVWFARAAVPAAAEYPHLFAQYTQVQAGWSTTVGLNGRQMAVYCAPSTGALVVDIRNEAGAVVATWTDSSPSGYESDGVWHHLAFRMQANKVSWSLWLDNEAKASGSCSSAINWKPGVLSIGGGYAPHLGNYGTYQWADRLAMFAAVNKPLSDNRVSEHYAAGAGGTVYYGDDEVERLTRIYDWTDTPIMCRDSDSALATLQGIEVAGTNALDALLDTAAAASGYVFADGQSWIQYHNKRHRYNRFSLFTFSETTASGVEAGIEFVTDDEKIYNDIRGIRPYGGSYRLVDTESVDEFGRRTYEFTLPITSAEELRNSVGWLLSRYGMQHLRISGVSLRAETSAYVEHAITGRIEIGDHIVIDDLPEWAPVQTMELAVEGMSLDADFVHGNWVMSFNLTPAEFDQVFQIGVSVLGGKDKVAL